MADFTKLNLTSAGLKALLESQAGKQLKLVSIKMGKGQLNGSFLSMRDLVSPVVELPISRKEIDKNGHLTIESTMTNESLSEGFEWREIGIFFQDTNGAHVLYAYANAGAEYDYIPAFADQRYLKKIRIAELVTEGTNITVTESEGLLYVDNASFDRLESEVEQMQPAKTIDGVAGSVENSAELPFSDFIIYGKSWQTKTTGGQLIPYPYADTGAVWSGITFVRNDDGSIKVNGTATANVYFCLAGGYSSAAADIPDWLIEGEQYTISGGDDGIGVALFLYPISGDAKSFIAYTTNNTFTMPSGYAYYGIFVYIANGRTVDKTIYPMLNKGATALPYELYSGMKAAPNPDYPQEIKNTGDDGEIAVGVGSKNIVQSTASTTDVTQYSNCLFVETDLLLPDTEYVLSFIGAAGHKVYANEQLFTQYQYVLCNGSREHLIVKTKPNISKDNVSHYNNGKGWVVLKNSENNQITPNFSDVQLELGNQLTDFEEGKEQQILRIATPNGLRGIPVSDGGNYTDASGQQWICDEIDLSRGVYIQRINNLSIAGNAYMIREEYPANSGKYRFKIDGQYSLPKKVIVACDMFKYSNTVFNDNGLDNVIAIYTNGSVYVRCDKFTTAEGFKAHLNNTQMNVVYALATPIETALTDAEIAAFKELHSNNPYTTVLNDSGAEMHVEAVSNVYENIFNMVFSNIPEPEPPMVTADIPIKLFINENGGLSATYTITVEGE